MAKKTRGSDMRILITGGSGFIGTNLVQFYLDAGAEVINIDKSPPRNAAHVHVWKRLDILNSDGLSALVTAFQPDYCFHLAARTDLEGRTERDYEENTKGLENIISAISGCADLKLAVFFSSMLVCKMGYLPSTESDYCPDTPYGVSKMQGEIIVRSLASGAFPWTIVRPTSIWGPWFATPYRDFFSAIQRGHYVHQRGLNVRRSYGFVLNTIFQLEKLRAVCGGHLKYATIYLADYEPVELNTWAELIQRKLNVNKIRTVPMMALNFVARIGDFVKVLGIKSPPLTSARLSNMRTSMVHNISPLEDLTGQLPYSTEQGVEITCDWMIGNRSLAHTSRTSSND